jgi:hypothetical protein
MEEPKNQQPSEENLTEEFRNLGKNLMEAVRAAWESPERRKLQQEIHSGLNELGATIRKEAESIGESPAGQRIKSEVKDAQQRIRSGEVEARVRDELLSALKTVNTELQKVIDSWAKQEGQGEQTGGASSPAAHQEIHPDDVESQVNRESGHQEIHPDDVESGGPAA